MFCEGRGPTANRSCLPAVFNNIVMNQNFISGSQTEEKMKYWKLQNKIKRRKNNLAAG
jgi:hypothetical protein